MAQMSERYYNIVLSSGVVIATKVPYSKVQKVMTALKLTYTQKMEAKLIKDEQS